MRLFVPVSKFVRRLGIFEVIISLVSKLFHLEFSANLTYFSVPPIWINCYVHS